MTFLYSPDILAETEGLDLRHARYPEYAAPLGTTCVQTLLRSYAVDTSNRCLALPSYPKPQGLSADNADASTDKLSSSENKVLKNVA